MRLAIVNLISVCLLILMCTHLHAATTNMVTTKHFIVRFEDAKMEPVAVFLEQAREQFTNFFKADDERKIQVRIFPNRKAFKDAIEHLSQYFLMSRDDKDYQAVYHRETATSYLYFREWNYRSRKLLLATASFQFHDMLRPWTTVPGLPACDEGLGQYLSLHNWDGKKLELGVIPLEEPINYPREALHHFKEVLHEDLLQLVEGKAPRFDPLSWALVAFLVEKDRARFDIWRTALNNGVDAPYAWERHFGPMMPELKVSFLQWMESKAAAWAKVANSKRS